MRIHQLTVDPAFQVDVRYHLSHSPIFFANILSRCDPPARPNSHPDIPFERRSIEQFGPHPAASKQETRVRRIICVWPCRSDKEAIVWCDNWLHRLTYKVNSAMQSASS